VIEYFEDLQDNRYAYNVNNVFPREGHEVTKERIEELASAKNRRGKPLIVKIEEKPKRKSKPKKVDKE
jgi:hypothetical protein